MLVCSFTPGEAQSKRLKGVVKDPSGEAMEGILVMVRSRPKEVARTNGFGRFVLHVRPGDTVLLVTPQQHIFPVFLKKVPKKSVTFILHGSDRTLTWDQNTFSALKNAETESMHDVLAVLQNTAYRRHYNHIFEMLRDRYPDLEIDEVSGKVYIRGVNSLNREAVLIIVDGIKDFPLSSVNPADVQSIRLVSDGTAGIYGGRAMGGVIIITTKKGMQ